MFYWALGMNILREYTALRSCNSVSHGGDGQSPALPLVMIRRRGYHACWGSIRNVVPNGLRAEGRMSVSNTMQQTIGEQVRKPAREQNEHSWAEKWKPHLPFCLIGCRWWQLVGVTNKVGYSTAQPTWQGSKVLHGLVPLSDSLSHAS